VRSTSEGSPIWCGQWSRGDRKSLGAGKNLICERQSVVLGMGLVWGKLELME